MQNQAGIDLRGILTVLYRWSWLIVACTLLAAIATYKITSTMAPEYEASLTLLVNPIRNTGGSVTADYGAGQQMALTYSQMLMSDTLLEQVISELGLPETPGTLADSISAAPINNTQLIRLVVRRYSPSEATQIANRLAEVFTAQVKTRNAQRYDSSLQDMQAKMDSLSASIADDQSQINSLNITKSTDDAELERLDFQLTQLSNDYGSLRQSYQSLQMTVAQLVDKVRVIDKALVIDPASRPNTSTTTISVDQSLFSSEGSISERLFSDLLIKTYGPMIKSDAVLQTTIDQLSLKDDVASLAKKIRLASIPDTQLFQLSVTDTDPSKSALVVETIANIFINQVRSLLASPYKERLNNMQSQMDQVSASIDQTQIDIKALKEKSIQTETELTRLNGQLAEDQNDYHTQQQNYRNLQLTIIGAAETVSIAEPAQTPVSPVSKRFTYLLFATFVGFVVGSGCAFLLEQLRDKIRTREDITKALKLTTIGTIGQMEKAESGHTIDSLTNHSIDSDFRKLSASIRLSSLGHPMKTLLITSPSVSEGKSMVTANLAIALANNGFRVIAVDTDLRLPHLHELFNLESELGLTDALLDGNSSQFLKPTRVDGLALMTSGSIPPNPAEILNSPTLAGLLKELSQEADIIILDSPPVLAAADATILASFVDGVVLILRAGSTSRQVAMETIEILRQVKANLIGVVLNFVPSKGKGYYQYYRKGGKKSTIGKLSRKEKLITHPIKGQADQPIVEKKSN